jgi:hypothetical protein
LTPEVKAPGTHSIGGRVGFRAGLDDVEKRKFSTLPGLELRPLGHPARSHPADVYVEDRVQEFLICDFDCLPFIDVEETKSLAFVVRTHAVFIKHVL